MDFPLSFVFDEMRAITRAYNAVCTPGFFVGFNTLLPKSQLRGGLDALQRNLPEACQDRAPRDA
ncbi:MAG: hypothetical protein LBV29_04710 [Azoarcus sp.]|nr:hypothetical protein [Azoarcus sp.]